MEQKKPTYIYLAAALAAAFIWGFFAIPLRRLHLNGYSADQILCCRVFASFVILWLFNLIFRQGTIRQDIANLKALAPAQRRNTLWLILGTGFFITGNWFSYIYVVNHISVKVAAFAYMICPLLTAAGGFLVLKEQLTKVKTAGIILAVFSIIILSTASLSHALWAMFVAVMYAAYLVIQRVLNQFDKINMLCVQLLIAMLMLLPYYVYAFKPIPQSPLFWLLIIVIAVVFTLVPLLLSMFALNGIPSSTLGITIYLNPVITFIVAFIWFSETFDRSQIIGYGLLLAAVIVFNWQTIFYIFSPNKVAKQPQLT
jgi:chloramphenicol-sensitive protein RarD